MDELRSRIDKIDRKLVELLEDRFEVAREIGKYKEEHNLSIYDAKRERDKIDSIGQIASKDKREYMERIMMKIMEQCRTFEEDNKVRYGLLGRRLGHSFSPQIHKALGGYQFGLFEKEPEELEAYMEKGLFDGICVTIPYKRDVMKYCSEISDIARESNSVNVVVRRPDGSLYGDNTDYYGFRYMIESEGFSVQGAKCLVLGSGGVSGTVKKALEDMGADSVRLISRSGEDNYENIDRHYDADIVVNATPVGMYPENGTSPVDIAKFSRCKAAVDLIYNPLRTRFVLDAEKAGIPSCGGMKMLVAQAAKACNLFTGKEICPETIEKVIKKTEIEQANIVMIGMPGAGKTSTGKILSNSIDREFIDMDCMVKNKTGMTPAEIIETEGEDAFRDIETENLKKALRRGGKVVACGGGVVERDENYEILRENSIVVYLKRDLDKLPVRGRPLSKDNGVEVLYRRRSPKYESWSDIQVDNVGVGKTAKILAKMIGLDREEEDE